MSPSSSEELQAIENNPRKHSNEIRKGSRVHRQRSRRNLMSNGQRQDLGTVNVRNELRKIELKEQPEEKSLVGEFVGSISSLLFGRKGGLL